MTTDIWKIIIKYYKIRTNATLTLESTIENCSLVKDYKSNKYMIIK